MDKPVVDTIIVTYHPKAELLFDCVGSLYDQVRKVIIVDNSEHQLGESLKSIEEFREKIELINLYENKGIAYAQNIGITRSLETGSDYIILSDQDTVFPEDYTAAMSSVFDCESVEIAAVAPLFHDAVGENENEGFVVNSKGFSKIFPQNGQYEILQAIASGLILNSKYLDSVGLMDEELFIDWVDLEWCWRAVARGYKIIGNANVQIEHNLGDDIVRLVDRNITVRSPVRHYYITRNAIHLAVRDHSLSLPQRFIILYKGIRYVLGFSIFVPPRVENIRMTLLGFFHGLIGQLGKLS